MAIATICTTVKVRYVPALHPEPCKRPRIVQARQAHFKSNPAVSREEPVTVRSRTDLSDEDGRSVGGWIVVGVLARGPRRTLRLDTQLLDCRVHLEPQERVLAVDEPWRILTQPLGLEGQLLVGSWSFQTGRGHAYRAVTTTTLRGAFDPDAPLPVERLEFREATLRRPSSIPARGPAEVSVTVSRSPAGATGKRAGRSRGRP
ncbi:MAG: hypothetical protein IPJ77_24470 [Planctomycetes bacterium]|nr:hypothetical protein [Planctomycetota bacterium]